MTNLQDSKASEFHTVYVELSHKWTGEKRYHAATIPTLITADEYLSQVWNAEGYESLLWTTDICHIVR
jgi:hypothetical protein